MVVLGGGNLEIETLDQDDFPIALCELTLLPQGIDLSLWFPNKLLFLYKMVLYLML